MAETGESYQRALARLRARTQASTNHLPREVDLLCVDYFGTEITLATFQILERLSCVVVPSSRYATDARPQSPLLALSKQRNIVH